ncbi:major tail protein [Microbacterium phage Musetta]|nr:major tail protein [Microbacterium phage Musetta]QYC54172.1 major tail protein [Microbacterium phage Welcome]
MANERLNSMGNVRFRLYADGAFANLRWPLASELNTGQELEQVTLWDSFSVGTQASDTSDAVPIGAKANVVRRGGANYGGNASFWYPGFRDDLTNAAALVYLALKELHTPGFISLSVDGEIGDPGQPPADMTFEAGDLVTVMKIVTDEWTDSITGEEAFYYTRNFLKAGGFAPYTVVSETAPVIEVTLDTAPAAIGSLGFVSATVNGREYTRGVRWSSSDISVATVSNTGVVRAIGAGTATITGTVPNASVLTVDSVQVTVA